MYGRTYVVTVHTAQEELLTQIRVGQVWLVGEEEEEILNDQSLVLVAAKVYHNNHPPPQMIIYTLIHTKTQF